MYAQGRLLESHYPIVPLAYEFGLSFAVFSYNQRMFVGAIADAAAIDDLDLLVSHVERAFVELRRAAGVDERAPVDVVRNESRHGDRSRRTACRSATPAHLVRPPGRPGRRRATPASPEAQESRTDAVEGMRSMGATLEITPGHDLPLWRELFTAYDWCLLHTSAVWFGAGVPTGDGSPVITIPGLPRRGHVLRRPARLVGARRLRVVSVGHRLQCRLPEPAADQADSHAGAGAHRDGPSRAPDRPQPRWRAGEVDRGTPAGPRGLRHHARRPVPRHPLAPRGAAHARHRPHDHVRAGAGTVPAVGVLHGPLRLRVHGARSSASRRRCANSRSSPRRTASWTGACASPAIPRRTGKCSARTSGSPSIPFVYQMIGEFLGAKP